MNSLVGLSQSSPNANKDARRGGGDYTENVRDNDGAFMPSKTSPLRELRSSRSFDELWDGKAGEDEDRSSRATNEKSG